MAAPTLRSSSMRNVNNANITTVTINTPAGTASGDLLLAGLEFFVVPGTTTPTFTPPSGWTLLRQDNQVVTDTFGKSFFLWYYKVAGGSEPSSYTFTCSVTAYTFGFISAITNAGTPEAHAENESTASSASIIHPSVTTLGPDRLVFYLAAINSGGGAHTPAAGFTELFEDNNSNIGDGDRSFGYKLFTAAGATGTFNTTLASSTTNRKVGFTVAVPGIAAPPPVANFTGTPLTGNWPLTVAFTDASTGSPTSWAWTFGDGGTSSSQNPSHTYAAAGTYTVTLVATNAGGSDTKTRTGYVTVGNPSGTFTKVVFGDHLKVTDLGGGVIRVDYI